MSKPDHVVLAELGIDPMLDTATVCAAEGLRARETLSRRVTRGEFPRPDRVIAGRNFWFRSTYLRWRETQLSVAS